MILIYKGKKFRMLLRLRASGGSGIDPSGTTTGAGGAPLTRDRRRGQRPRPPSGVVARPGLSRSIRSLCKRRRGAPWRRAPLSPSPPHAGESWVGAPRPEHFQMVTSGWRGADIPYAPGAPPPSFSGRQAIVAFVNKTWARARRENASSRRAPASVARPGMRFGALVGRDVISIDEPRRGNCHETSAIC